MENKKSWTGSKVLYVVISLLVAGVIWMWVDNTKDGGVEVTKTFSDIPIEYSGEDTILADRGLMLLSQSDQTVTLELRAKRFTIGKLDPNKIRVVADLSNVTSTGTQSVNYAIYYNVASDLVSVRYRPAVKISVGELYSREVEIHCALEGTVADGYIAGELKFKPGVLEIRGPKTSVDKVAYARTTLPVDNATETITKTLDYALYDADDQLIEDTADLHATADQIQVTLPVNVVKELPLQMNFLEAPGAAVSNLDYSISPASITVSGDAALLKDVKAIVLEEFDLSKFSVPTTYNYEIRLPENCENLSGTKRAMLTIQFKDIASSAFTVTNFTCENVPEGKTVTVLTTELPVTLRGTAADVAAVAAEDITIVADLTDMSDAGGSYTVSAAAKIDTAGDVGVLGTYQIRITIADSGAEAPPPVEEEPPAQEPAEDTQP